MVTAHIDACLIIDIYEKIIQQHQHNQTTKTVLHDNLLCFYANPDKHENFNELKA